MNALAKLRRGKELLPDMLGDLEEPKDESKLNLILTSVCKHVPKNVMKAWFEMCYALGVFMSIVLGLALHIFV